jgi:hypothetical protein
MKKPACGFVISLLVLFFTASAFAAEGPCRFLLLDAYEAENQAKIGSGPAPCHKTAPTFLDRREAAELHVVRRKFLTDYNVEITGVTSPHIGAIRGIEEAANLSLGPSTLITPPTKGGVNALSPITSASVLQQLLDETQVNKPAAQLQADYQELLREKNQLELELRGLADQYLLLMKAHPGVLDCSAIGGDPDLIDVADCLRAEIDLYRKSEWDPTKEPYGNENGFRSIILRTQYLLDVMGALQGMLNRSSLPTAVFSIEADLTQFEKNVDTFQANLQAIQTATALYFGLKNQHEQNPQKARLEIRRAQLMVYFTNQLKASSSDGSAAVDPAEINQLVNAVVDFLKRSGFAIADAQVVALADCPSKMQAETDRRIIAVPLRKQLTQLESDLKTTVPDQIATVNARQSQLVERINFIYDHSAVTEPLVKQIDLSSYSGNLVVYYKIHRTENFARYAVVTPVVGNVGGVSPGALALPAIAATPTANPATTQGTNASTITTTTTSVTGTTTATTTTPAATSSSAPTTGDVVAQGSFQAHEFDRATVVAGFVFSRIQKNNFTAVSSTTAGATTYTVGNPTQSFQPQVFLGVDYYLSPKDTYPNRTGSYHLKLSDFGALGGVSANTFNNYFAGVAWEPSLGFNFGVGAHMGTEKRLQNLNPGDAIPSSTVPTYDKRVTKLFIMAGFDLQIFRKVFGKVTGVGTAATSTSSSQ